MAENDTFFRQIKWLVFAKKGSFSTHDAPTFFLRNFERENKRMQFKLKENFYDDDNANSLIFHYLAVGGITSFLLIVFIIYTYFKRLIKLTDLKKLKILALIFFLVALNFQRELLSHQG